MFIFFFFFFKQKTAYEMRISDWSSDVCSSDLVVHDFVSHVDGRAVFLQRQFDDVDGAHYTGAEPSGTGQDHSHSVCLPGRDRADRARPPSRATSPPFDRDPCRVRSEEHTSELPSLMRISYAVFCLKKHT